MKRGNVCHVIEAPPSIRLWLMWAERDSRRQTLWVKDSRKASHSSLRLPLDVHEHHGATVDVELST